MLIKLRNTKQRIKAGYFRLSLFKDLRSWIKEGDGLAPEKL
jgi:hypothetical protein